MLFRAEIGVTEALCVKLSTPYDSSGSPVGGEQPGNFTSSREPGQKRTLSLGVSVRALIYSPGPEARWQSYEGGPGLTRRTGAAPAAVPLTP